MVRWLRGLADNYIPTVLSAQQSEDKRCIIGTFPAKNGTEVQAFRLVTRLAGNSYLYTGQMILGGTVQEKVQLFFFLILLQMYYPPVSYSQLC